MTGLTRRLRLGAALLLAAALAVPAGAGEWDSRAVVRTEGSVVLIAPPGAERTLEALGPQAQSIVAGVSLSLGIQPRAPYSMVLIPVAGLRDPELLAFDRGAPAWAAGFMDPPRRMGAIRLAQASRYPYGTPEAVLAHESAHLLIHDARGVDLPLWYEEGVATWAARAWQFEDVFQISSRLMTHDLPKFDALEPLFHGNAAQADQAYAASFAFVSWSVARFGSTTVRDVLTEARTHSFGRAWRIATGVPLDRAEADWRRESLFRYRWLPLIAGSGSVWLVIMMLSALAWVRKRRRARALEAVWEHEAEGWMDTGEWAEQPPEGDAAASQAAQEPPHGGPGIETGSPVVPPPTDPPTLVWRRVDPDEEPTEPK